MVADLRETYHVGLSDVAPWEAAELVTRLPASSRLARAEAPESAWPEDHVYLARIEFWLHALLWRDARRSSRGPRPDLLVPDALAPKGDARRIRGVAMTTSEIDALFHVKTE